MRRWWPLVLLPALVALVLYWQQRSHELDGHLPSESQSVPIEIVAADIEPRQRHDGIRSEQVPTESEASVPTGILILGVLPDGTVVSPDQVSGYRGAVPKTWSRGPRELRINEEASGDFFLHASWGGPDGAAYTGSDWFSLDGVAELRIPMTPTALRLSGLVRKSGLAVAGHAIHVSGSLQRYSTLTDLDGRFQFDLPRAESIIVKVGYMHCPSFRQVHDFSAGGEQYLEFELPLGELALEVVFPEGVQVPSSFAAALSPINELAGIDRKFRKLAPVREDSIARFEGLAPGEYHLYVGAPDFGQVDFVGLGISCYEGRVVIANETERLRIEMPALTRVALFVPEEGHPKQGLSCFASYQRLDGGFASLPGRELTTTAWVTDKGEVMAPGRYLFHVGGNGNGWADVEFEVLEGQDNFVEVVLEQPGFTVSAELEAIDYAQIQTVYYFDQLRRCIGKFSANNGSKFSFKARDKDGSLVEVMAHDSATPRPGAVHVPGPGVYTFVAVLRSSQGAVSLGEHAISESTEAIHLEFPK